ncbi:MAG: hypothetical protein ACPHF2_02550 [Crocinitomicaceae bacterium]
MNKKSTAYRTDDGWICSTCNKNIFSGCEHYFGEWQCLNCKEWTYPMHNEIEDGCMHCGSNEVRTEFKLLDLFCCGGGAGVGYARSGFTVTGIDIKNQPEYPYEFIECDAVEYLQKHGHKFEAIHASPPCQAYSSHVTSSSSKFVPTKGKDEPMLIGVLRDILNEIGKPYVIENVIGARQHMDANLMLCGTMFGLPISRHRLFESNFFIPQPEHPKCRGVAKKFAADNGWEYRDMSVTGKGRHAGTSERWKQIMGIDWDLRQSQLAEAIPSSYTKYIGDVLINQLIEKQ